MKYRKSNLTKSNKRGGKSPTSGLKDWQPKRPAFRDTKTGGRQFQMPAKKFP
jgi:hypothetical protein